MEGYSVDNYLFLFFVTVMPLLQLYVKSTTSCFINISVKPITAIISFPCFGTVFYFLFSS